MKESRLFRIVYYLLDKGQVTASELAKRFEVSTRTIYRDVDALSAAGIPIYAETGRSGGIHLMEGFVLDKAILSDDEKQEILTALQSTNTAQNVSDSQTLQKLSAIFNLNFENWLEVDFSRWGNNGTDNEKFELLRSAVIQKRCVKITYAGSGGEISERIVQPLKMVYKSMSWYLKAYCTEKQDFRIFKLMRIISAEVLPDSFSPLTFPEINETARQNYNEIIICFSKSAAHRVYDEFDRTQVQQKDNGDLIVCANMPQDDWLVGYILSFGTQAEVIEPVSLKKVIAERAKEIYDKNKS